MSFMFISALAGVAFHHCFARHVELDFHVLRLASSFVSIGLLLISYQVWFLSSPIIAATRDILHAATVFFLALTSSILVHRGLFHRLRNIPGPSLARFSSFYMVKKCCDDDKFHLYLAKLHQEYGDVVRIGPRQVSIARADALPHIANLVKGTFYVGQHHDIDPRKTGMVLIRDVVEHKSRRKPWELAFTSKALRRHNEGIQELVRLFVERLASTGTVDITTLTSRFAFDVMGLVGFSRSFDLLAKDQSHAALSELHSATPVIGRFRFVPWLIHLMLSIPRETGPLDTFTKTCEEMLRQSQAAFRDLKTSETDMERPKDIMSSFLWAVDTNDPSAPPTDEALGIESRTIIHAGTDNTATGATHALWFLAAYPECLKELQRRLDANFPGGHRTFEFTKLNESSLEWLDAIIQEVLRIRPPVASWLPRTTGPQGLLIPASDYGPEIYLPPEVEVGCPPYIIQRDARYFDRPTEFLPERWLEGSTLRCERKAWFPFFQGRTACVAKPLAMLELRSILSRTSIEYDLEFTGGTEKDWKGFYDKTLDGFTSILAPLHLTFKTRAQESDIQN